MAYGNYLAAVDEAQVNLLRNDLKRQLVPSAVEMVSHLVAYWIKVQPLGSLLGEILDGGLVLSSELWHPLRPPMFHPPGRVNALATELSKAWRTTQSAVPLGNEPHWHKIEIEKVERIMQVAAESHNCIVSVLERPSDEERGRRVRIPFEETIFGKKR